MHAHTGLRQAKQQSKISATRRRFGGASIPGLVEFRSRVELKVDFAERTITGYASEFNTWDSYNDVMLPGSFARTVQERFHGFSPPRIKVLTGHDWAAAVGIPLHMEEDDRGLLVVSKIANTDRGTELLTLADEGVNDGLSVGFFIPQGGAEWIDFETIQDLNEMGYGELPIPPEYAPPRAIKDTDLIEYSHTPFPAVDGARVEARDMILRSLARTVVQGAKHLPTVKTRVAVREVIPHREFPLADVEAEWDGQAEIAAASVEDLVIMSTWVDAEFPDVESSYKLPHHRQSDKYTVWRGVVAAMAALLGARGGVDIPEEERQGVYDHLAAHYREFGEEPPEFRTSDDASQNEHSSAGVNDDANQPSVADEVRDVLNINARMSSIEEHVKVIAERIDALASSVDEIRTAQPVEQFNDEQSPSGDGGDEEAALSVAFIDELTQEWSRQNV